LRSRDASPVRRVQDLALSRRARGAGMLSLKHLLLVCLAMGPMAAANAAFADDSLPPFADKAAPAGNDNQHAEFYTGIDVAARGWLYGWVEGTVAPFTNTDTSGLRLRVYGETGTDEYQSQTFEGTTNRELWSHASALAGYAFEQEHLEVEGFVGPAVVDVVLKHADPDNQVQGARAGPEFSGDFEWTNYHLLFSGWGYYTTAFSSYEATLKFGPEIARNVYIGPEVGIIGDTLFTQWRVGGHITALNIGTARVSFGAGFENDSIIGSGMYFQAEGGLEF
jgi:hypothetical protein